MRVTRSQIEEALGTLNGTTGESYTLSYYAAGGGYVLMGPGHTGIFGGRRHPARQMLAMIDLAIVVAQRMRWPDDQPIKIG